MNVVIMSLFIIHSHFLSIKKLCLFYQHIGLAVAELEKMVEKVRKNIMKSKLMMLKFSNNPESIMFVRFLQIIHRIYGRYPCNR